MPLTAFIIVMEMVDGHAMALGLMACAMLAGLVSRMIDRTLYETRAELMVRGARPLHRPWPPCRP
ncbi:MAG: hypothetical protein ACRYGA_07200 [Janthinobacterium lividum]